MTQPQRPRSQASGFEIPIWLQSNIISEKLSVETPSQVLPGSALPGEL